MKRSFAAKLISAQLHPVADIWEQTASKFKLKRSRYEGHKITHRYTDTQLDFHQSQNKTAPLEMLTHSLNASLG